MKHASHPEIVKRLKRAHGHLGKVLSMFEDGRPCLDLAQQLHAVENAVANAKRELIHDHIEHCLEASETEGASYLEELKQLTKFL
ncbi:MAG: metal-sensing transcriptional repressor [Bradyrhizobium sp.]|nr:MAG: metal-sensing transcriptional repressor [Bradyrhizobium sp.]